mgnify:CR=1 FL=1
MKIRSTIDLVGRTYHVTVDTPQLTPAEQELINQFGPPLVETGGAIAGSAQRPGDVSPTAVSFTLATCPRYLPEEFPAKQLFSLDDHADADLRAVVYRTTMEGRLAAARNALMSHAPNFVGETVTTL